MGEEIEVGDRPSSMTERLSVEAALIGGGEPKPPPARGQLSKTPEVAPLGHEERYPLAYPLAGDPAHNAHGASRDPAKAPPYRF